MKNIGKYNGISCYTATMDEYMECMAKEKDDGSLIFIVDGTMVKDNKIIGYYDGKFVKDVYDEKPFIRRVPKKPSTSTSTSTFTADKPVSVVTEKYHAETPVATVVATYEEVVAQEIRFENYSTVVDEFFALLEASK